MKKFSKLFKNSGRNKSLNLSASLANKRWPKLLVLAIGLVMFFTKYTDADLIDVELIQDNLLRATTLDFANKSTANEMPVSTFFNITGLLSNGFEVKSIRIKREGEMNFSYQINTQNMTGDEVFCDSLIVTIMKDWEPIFEGQIATLNYLDALAGARYQDLVLVLKTDGSGRGMGGKSCQFDFLVRTNLEPQDSAFSDEEILQNQVISGAF